MHEAVERYRNGETQREIAEALGLSQSTVSRILHRAGEPVRGGGRAAPVGTRWKVGNYYVIKTDPSDPVLAPMAHKDGRVLEHRAVMAQHLGRPLLPSENVHHLNGNGHDNRLENLELWNRAQPPSTRASDLVAWAKKIIEEYDR